MMDISPLKRSMKTLGALLITLSSITPAASVFIIAPGVMQQAGSGAFYSFVVAAVISLLTAFAYAEASSAFPFTGGEYTIVGRVLGPLAGFIVLGVNIASLILIAAVIALGLGTYLGVVFPGISVTGAGVACIIVTTLSGILNVRTNAFVTGIFLAVELITLCIVAALGFTHITRPFSDLILHPQILSDGALAPAGFSAIGLATVVAVFAYNGFGNAVYLGEEIHDASKHIARTIILSLIVTVIAEAVPVTAVLLGTPDLKDLLGSQNMLSDFIASTGGNTLNMVVSLGIAFAIINANIAFLVMVSRQVFSTGRDHVWNQPVNHALTRIHSRFHSPWVATLVCGVLASAACFIGLNMLLVLTGTSVVVVYAAICIAVIAGRRNGSTAHGIYRMPFYPLPAVLALIALVYVIYANYLDEAVGRPSLWITLGMVVVSAGYYFAVLRRRGRWVLRGPQD